MPYTVEQKIKLLVLWDILCRNTDETHALNTDEIIEMLAEKGISVGRKVLVQDIDLLNRYGYEVLSYKKKYHYYYVASRVFDTAEIAMLADVVKASKLTSTQKSTLITKLSETNGKYALRNYSLLQSLAYISFRMFLNGVISSSGLVSLSTWSYTAMNRTSASAK